MKLQAQEAGAISVSFTGLPDGAPLAPGSPGQRLLDLGAVSAGAGSRTPNVQVRRLKDRLVVATRFGLNIQDPARHFVTATIMASLAYPDYNHAVWLDGVKLSTAPQIVQGQAPVGGASAHRLEIEVPDTLTEKNSGLNNAIIFQVMPN